MPVSSNEHRDFSWLKALGHSIAIGCVFFLTAVAFSVAGVVNATKAGEFSGGFVMAGLILGWIWSYARPRGSSTGSQVVVVILVAMSAYQVFVLAFAAATRAKVPAVLAL